MKRKRKLEVVFLGMAALALCSCNVEKDIPSSSFDTVSINESVEFSQYISLVDTNPYPYVDTVNVKNDGEGNYEVANFRINLPAQYKQQLVDDISFFASDGVKSSVVLSVNSFRDMYDSEIEVSISAKEYAIRLVEAQDIMKVPVYDSERGAYFEYVQDLNDKQYRYYAYTYKGKTAFYLLQFCCNEEDTAIYRSYFSELEKNITID